MASCRRAGVAVAILAGFLVGGLVPAAGQVAEASPVAASVAGWQPAWSSDFTGSALPAACGTYGGVYSGGQNAWSADEVVVSGGLLRVKLERKAAAGKPYSSGGVGCWGHVQRYGRYEIRAKMPRGKGIDSYLTLWPANDNGADGLGVEVLAPGPDTAYISNGFGTGDGKPAPGSYADAFHTWVLEWEPGLTRVSVDGHTLYSGSRSYAGNRWLGLVVSNGDALTGVPDASTTLPAEFQIDWVRVSTYLPGGGAVTTPAGAGTPANRTGAPARTTSRPTPGTSPSRSSAAPASTPAGSGSGSGSATPTAADPIRASAALDPASADRSGGTGPLVFVAVAVLAGAVLAGGLAAYRFAGPAAGRHRPGGSRRHSGRP